MAIDCMAIAREATDRYKAVQKREELAAMLELIAHYTPTRGIEIGTRHGGTAFALAQVTDHVLTIDNDRLAFDVSGLDVPNLTFLKGQSEGKTTIDFALRWLEGEKADYLFIDGDHEELSVMRDYENYEPMVRDGGLVFLHDVRPTFHGVSSVVRAWDKLRDGKVHGKIIFDPGSWNTKAVGFVPSYTRWGGIGWIRVNRNSQSAD